MVAADPRARGFVESQQFASAVWLPREVPVVVTRVAGSVGWLVVASAWLATLKGHGGMAICSPSCLVSHSSGCGVLRKWCIPKSSSPLFKSVQMMSTVPKSMVPASLLIDRTFVCL